MRILQQEEIAPLLTAHPEWTGGAEHLSRVFTAADFPAAIAVVDKVAVIAEEVNHHPDIDIRWNTVTLALSSHDEGGLTDRDFQLAARIQELDQPTQPA